MYCKKCGSREIKRMIVAGWVILTYNENDELIDEDIDADYGDEAECAECGSTDLEEWG